MNTHELRGRPPAAMAALLVAVLATAATGTASAQVPARKPVKWVVTCPAPRATAKPESAPTAALEVPDPVQGMVDALGTPPAAAASLVPTAAPGPTGQPAASEVRAAASEQPSQGRVAGLETAAATPTAAVFRVATVPRWEVLTSDMTLSKTLARWAQEAGYRLQWDAPRNFLIGAPTGFSGDFETAVSALLSTPGIRLSEFPLEACVYSNSPPLLRITRYGEQARECAVANPSATRTANLP